MIHADARAWGVTVTLGLGCVTGRSLVPRESMVPLTRAPLCFDNYTFAVGFEFGK